MTSDAERRLQEMGCRLEEVDFGREDEPDIDGFALVGLVVDGIRVNLIIRPGLAEEFRTAFAEWAVQRLERFMEHGPEPDGWQRRSDGDWQLWVRHVELPPI